LIPDLSLKSCKWIDEVERVDVVFRGTLAIETIGGGVMLTIERRTGIGIRITSDLI
jgi:hypothetical protein